VAKESNKKLRTSKARGFTFIEILIVVSILGMMILISYPDIQRTIEVRGIENEAREILTTMQRAKFQAVKTKLNHRIEFEYKHEEWFFYVEREVNPGQWSVPPGFTRNNISSKFVVDVSFPDQTVVFSPLGFIINFDSQQNSISLQSEKLKRYGQPDLRVISVFAGGSIRYVKMESE